MEPSELLKQKLNTISTTLRQRYKEETDLGVVSGVSGIALFQFYYSKYLDIDTHADLGAEMISHCIEQINEGYSHPTFCTGIAGLGWTIQHLKANDFIDVDCDDLLSPFDTYLYNQMMYDLKRGNYDFLHGGLGYGFYFLSRFEHTENSALKKLYQGYLEELITTLEELSISEGDTLKWESVLDIEKGNKGYNLSLSHGISSILNFLSRLHRFEMFQASTYNLIRGAANYLLGFEDKNPAHLSLFPSWVETDVSLQYNSRIAWCYGDLGIGLSLLEAGKSLNDAAMREHALNVLYHTTHRTSGDQTMVVDAGVCHGSYGNALIYQKLHQENNAPSFEKMLHFWIEDGIEKAVHTDGYAGYKQWNGLKKDWSLELSLLEGIAGIGLVLIDYLSEEPNTWAECLMIR